MSTPPPSAPTAAAGAGALGALANPNLLGAGLAILLGTPELLFAYHFLDKDMWGVRSGLDEVGERLEDIGEFVESHDTIDEILRGFGGFI